MKVLIAAGIFPPETGGPATYAKILVDELPKRGVAVEVAMYRVVRTLPPILRHMAYVFVLLKKSRGADIIFAQDPVSVGLPARIAATLARKKFVVRVGGDFAWEQGVQRYGVEENLDEFVSNTQRHAWRVRLLQRIEAWVARGAQTVIAPSQYLKKIITTWGVDPEKIRVVYSAISIPPLPSKEDAREKFGFGDQPVIVSAGRLVPWKGFPRLIDAFALVRKDFPDAKLLIAGEGPLRRTLIAAASSNGNVKLLGALSLTQLLQLIRAADLFVLNSGYEGLSHQLVEVMQIGTAIVTTDVGGNAELLENGKEGILVQYDNVEELSGAMQRILSGEIRTASLIAAARLKAAQFSTEHMIEETCAALGIESLELSA